MSVKTHDATPPATEPAPDRPDELRELIHDLRNHVNALLMNAGVVAANCRDAERMAPFVARIEAEGERCAATLQRLSDRCR